VARRISIDEAFRELRPALGPNGAIDEMNKAMQRYDKRVRLFCNRRVVDPDFIRDHLIVKGPGSRSHPDRPPRQTAEIVATRALDKPIEKYIWKMDSDEIAALLPMPELAKPWPTVSGSVNWTPPAILAPATPPLSSEIDRILDDLPQRSVGGRPPKHKWRDIYAEIARRCIDPQTGRLQIPESERKLAQDMLDWCGIKYGKEPAESEMRDAVNTLCAALRPLQK